MAMTDQQKMDFVHKQTKLALQHVQHFDSGGTALGGPNVAGTANAVNPSSQGIGGSVGGFLGVNNNFQATGANIQNGTNLNQLNSAYSGAQQGLAGANNLANQTAAGTTQGLGSQNNLTNQLTAESNGQGPNPAQAALNQQTGQNIQQQAALMASQRGGGANAGLLASQAAQQGANTQQQAVGQSATLQAQQQLNAQNQLQNLASTQVGQGQSATELQNQTQQNEQNILQGANTANNNANVSMQENINNTNAAVAAGNQNSNQNVDKALGNAASSLGGAGNLFAEGGKALPPHLKHLASIYHPEHLAGGGLAWQNSQPVTSSISSGPQASLPGYTGTFGQGGSGKMPSPAAAPTNVGASDIPTNELAGGAGDTAGMGAAAGGGGELASLAPLALAAAFGGKAPGKNVGSKMKEGGKVPGKPKVDKDDYSNDTVSAKLSPGEVVMDLDTLKDKGKLGQMARFVAKEIERKKAGRKP